MKVDRKKRQSLEDLRNMITWNVASGKLRILTACWRGGDWIALQIIRVMEKYLGVCDKNHHLVRSLPRLSKSYWCAKSNAFFKEKENDILSGYLVWEEVKRANNPFPLPPLNQWSLLESSVVRENENSVNEANTLFKNKHQCGLQVWYGCLYFCIIYVFCNVFHSDVRYRVSGFDEIKNAWK